jgi:hypothetical protein
MSTEDDDDDGDVSGYYTDMGDGRTVMVGEISDALFKSEELDGAFGENWGWWLVDFDGPGGTRVVAKCISQWNAWELMDTYVAGIRAQGLQNAA